MKRPRRISKHMAFSYVSGTLAKGAMRKLIITLQQWSCSYKCNSKAAKENRTIHTTFHSCVFESHLKRVHSLTIWSVQVNQRK